MTSEFEIIQRHFNKKTKHTILGIGDDAAIIKIQKNYELVVSSDMLIENIHFQKKLILHVWAGNLLQLIFQILLQWAQKLNGLLCRYHCLNLV